MGWGRGLDDHREVSNRSRRRFPRSRRAAHGQPGDGVTIPARAFVLVTAADCHLCAHAQEVLGALGIGVRVIDVGSPDAGALAARGVPLAFLPVLTDGRDVIAYGRFSARRLRKEFAL